MLQMHLMQTNTACKYNTYNSELNKQSNWRRKAKKQLQFSEKKQKPQNGSKAIHRLNEYKTKIGKLIG